MARQPLFSTYRTGENRVTSSMLAVFQRIDLSLVERLLGEASGESSLSMITFQNQVTSPGANAVPDGAISASFRYLFEVKTSPNAFRSSKQVEQLQRHLMLLDGDHADKRLFVITPDAELPTKVADLADQRVVWMSFASLYSAIEELLADTAELVGERTEFLLRELQSLIRVEGLLPSKDVVIVAAREAYPEYQEVSAYVCQPGRAFAGGITHLGFYAQGAIRPEIARIVYREDNVTFSSQEADARADSGSDHDQQMADVIRRLLDDGPRTEGNAYQVFLLSGPDEPGTVKLPQAIVNTTKAASGRSWAWTLGQRYTSLESLLTHPATTTELDATDAA
jgi:hypothetical protein